MTIEMNLGTPTSEPRKGKTLYASSAKIHPRKVSGTFRSVKWGVVALLLAFWHFRLLERADRVS